MTMVRLIRPCARVDAARVNVIGVGITSQTFNDLDFLFGPLLLIDPMLLTATLLLENGYFFYCPGMFQP